MKQLLYLPFVLVALALSACTQEREVEVDLPAHQSELFVEAYLEDGEPLRLALSQTEQVTDPISGEGFVEGARVSINRGDTLFRLKNEAVFDTETNKFFNYTNLHRVRAQPGRSYSLRIEGPKGRTLTGQTQFLEPIPLDTFFYTRQDPDTLGKISFRFQDPPGENNFYRVLVNEGQLRDGSKHDVLITDEFFDGEKIPFSTRKLFAPQDTAWLRVLHLSESYYNYLRTAKAAKLSNGNPFSQPARVQSTVSGGEGVFAAITETRKRWVLP